MKSIIMSIEDVYGILDGRKTQTRRVVKEDRRGEWAAVNGVRNNSEYGASVPCYLHRETAVDDISRNIMYPKYDVGDILWVRETWFREDCTPDCAGREDENECPFNRVGNACYGYKAQYLTGGDDIKWRPSIFMPKEAARIFLRVTDVRVERVQDISAEDCEAEGYFETAPVEPRPRSWFSAVWDACNAKRGYGWDSNPWVWVYTFERVDKPAGWPGGEVEG